MLNMLKNKLLHKLSRIW